MITRNRWFQFGATILVACILIVNWLLAEQNKNLKGQLDHAIHKEFHTGDILKSFGGVDVGGRLVTANFAGAPKQTLLIGFSTGCSACKANMKNWLELSSQLSRDEWRVLWVSQDPNSLTADFVRAHQITDEVLSDFSCSTYDYLGLRMVPRMVVVGRDGKIRKIWNGALTSQEWDEVFGYFRAREVLASRR